MPFLIDGHNLIPHTGLRLDDPDDEQKLIKLLRDYLGRVRKKGVVIFDRGLPGGASRWSSYALEVRFAPAPRTADDLIRERLRREKNPRGLTVVTGDRAVAEEARRAGARVVGSAEFAREMLAKPGRPHEKDSNLSPEEVARWEEEFKKRGR